MKTGNVKRNFVYNALYQILIIVLPLVTAPYVSRVLHADKIGEYAYHFSIAKIFVIFAMLGLNNYGNRTIAAVRDDEEELANSFSSIYIMQVTTSLFSIILYFGYILICKQGKMAYILTFYVVSSAFDINWFFFGLEQFKLTVLRNTAIKLLSVACIFIFVKETSDVYIYGLILALSFICSQLAIWPFVKRYTHFVKPTKESIIRHIKPNIKLFIPIIAVSLYKYMDKIMLGSLTNMTEVGYYENAEKIIDIPVVLVASLGTVMLPKMSNLAANKRNKDGEKYIYYSVLFAVFLASSLGFGIITTSRVFVPWFFGDGFDACIPLASILALSTIFIAVANVMRTQYLIPMHEDKTYIISVFIGAITNIILNLLLIPGMKSAGAAIGTLAAEAAVCIYQFKKIKKEANFANPIIKSTIFIASGVIMWLVVRSIPIRFTDPLLILLFEVVVGIVAFFVSLILILIIRKYVFKRENVFPDGIISILKKG